jgi:ectoine hydroxylase-related dioxygenase (phytanoyl-CoA dioxygenase family)
MICVSQNQGERLYRVVKISYGLMHVLGRSTAMMPSYPDIDWRSSSPGSLASLYEQHGVVVLRNLFEKNDWEALASVARMAFAIGDAMTGLLPAEKLPEDLAHGLVRHGWVTWPRTMEWLRLLGLDGRIELSAVLKKVETAAGAFYKHDCRILDASSFRRHRGEDDGQGLERVGYTHEGGTFVPWHRDYAVAGTAQFGEDAVNFWIPFADVGEHAPSLELVLGSHFYMKSIPVSDPLENLTPEWIDQHLPNAPRWTPHCKVGDVIAFDHQTVHQTQWLKGPMRARMSLELRCGPASTETKRGPLEENGPRRFT